MSEFPSGPSVVNLILFPNDKLICLTIFTSKCQRNIYFFFATFCYLQHIKKCEFYIYLFVHMWGKKTKKTKHQDQTQHSVNMSEFFWWHVNRATNGWFFFPNVSNESLQLEGIKIAVVCTNRSRKKIKLIFVLFCR